MRRHVEPRSVTLSPEIDRLAARFAATVGQQTHETVAVVFGSSDALRQTGGLIRAVHVAPSTAAKVQLTDRFDVGIITAEAWASVPEWERRLLVHNLVAHLRPGALVLTDVDPHEVGEHAFACGLLPEGEQLPPAFRRTSRTTVHDLVAEARSILRRLCPADLAQRLDSDPSCVVLDTRTPTDRERFGVIPGSVHMPRTTLEWMCDPASGYSHERIVSFEQCLVAVCNEGYSSSLSAASLQRLGFVNATDLIGGVLGWKAADLPVEFPDHTRFN
jgi:rhodanese-related sulfurtransferase